METTNSFSLHLFLLIGRSRLVTIFFCISRDSEETRRSSRLQTAEGRIQHIPVNLRNKGMENVAPSSSSLEAPATSMAAAQNLLLAGASRWY